jgi:hypothetical protein
VRRAKPRENSKELRPSCAPPARAAGESVMANLCTARTMPSPSKRSASTRMQRTWLVASIRSLRAAGSLDRPTARPRRAGAATALLGAEGERAPSGAATGTTGPTHVRQQWPAVHLIRYEVATRRPRWHTSRHRTPTGFGRDSANVNVACCRSRNSAPPVAIVKRARAGDRRLVDLQRGAGPRPSPCLATRQEISGNAWPRRRSCQMASGTVGARVGGVRQPAAAGAAPGPSGPWGLEDTSATRLTVY